MKILSILLFILPTIIFSQKNNMVEMSPDPYDKIRKATYFKEDNFFKLKDYTDIKIAYRIQRTKLDQFESDTISKVFYNTIGEKIKEIRYGINFPRSMTEFFYSDGQLIKSVETDLTNPKDRRRGSYQPHQTIKRMKYDQSGSLSETITVQLKINGDTINHEQEINFYKNKQIISNQFLLPSNKKHEYQVSNIDTFIYDKSNRLIKHFYFQPRSLRNNNETIYQYDKIGNLISMKYYEPRFRDTTIREANDYKYLDRKLIEKNSYTFLTRPKNVKTTYTYNNDGRLKEMSDYYLDNYKKSTFDYSDPNKLVINVETNGSTHLGIGIPYNNSSSKKGKITTHQRVIQYDKKGNLIGLQYFTDEKIQIEVEVLIEYY